MVSNFEKKYSKYAIPNLTLYLLIGYGVGYVLGMINPNLYSLLEFNPYMVLHGQVWRIVTWVLTMPENLSLFTIIMFFLYYSLGRTLEHTWGTYRYNVYLLSGFLFTVVGAFILYFILCIIYGMNPGTMSLLGSVIGAYTSTYYINMSIFLAFAATYPDMEVLLYFVIPVKIKWMGLLYGAIIFVDIYDAFKYCHASGQYLYAIIVTIMIVLSLLNFIIYFVTTKGKMKYNPKQVKRKQQFKQSVKKAQTIKTYEGGAHHKCVICGRTELDDPNLTFRYCSKCSGNKEYCQDHLFTHTHR